MKILISGEGGQGIQLISQIIANTAYDQKYNSIYIPHYGVEMRMGISFAYIQIQKDLIHYPKFVSADILAILTTREAEIPKSFINKDTRIINAVDLGKQLEDKSINTKSINMLVLGIIVKELNTSDFRLDNKKIKDQISQKFYDNKEILDSNIKAFELGLILENEIYSKNIDKITKRNLIPIVDKDNKKTHIKFPNLCKGCGLCLEMCPVKALSWQDKKLNYISRPIPKVEINKCIACMNCENICPDTAIRVIKN